MQLLAACVTPKTNFRLSTTFPWEMLLNRSRKNNSYFASWKKIASLHRKASTHPAPEIRLRLAYAHSFCYYFSVFYSWREKFLLNDEKRIFSPFTTSLFIIIMKGSHLTRLSIISDPYVIVKAVKVDYIIIRFFNFLALSKPFLSTLWPLGKH